MSRRDKFGVCGLFTCLALLVSLPATAGPALSLSTNSVVVQGTGGSDASATMQVINAGNGALKWSVMGVTPSWLSVSPASGTNHTVPPHGAGRTDSPNP